MPITNATAGIKKLSQLIIDADKNWQLKGISNIKELAAGMQAGDILAHDGTRIIRIPISIANLVLTSDGLMPYWAPAGTYFNRYFPVEVFLSKIAGKFTPNHTQMKDAQADSEIGVEDNINADWFYREEPEVALPHAEALFTPDHSHAVAPALEVVRSAEVPVSGALADDGGVFTDETAAAKSSWVQYENYTAGEDSSVTMSGSSNWEAETFTPATTHKLRFVWVRIARSSESAGPPGDITISIRATAANIPTGIDLAVQTFSPYGLVYTPQAWFKVYFDTPVEVSLATKYAACMRSANGGIRWACDATAPAYANGARCYSSNGGATWTEDVVVDFMFEEWGTPVEDLHMFPVAIAVGDAWYWGYDTPFDYIDHDTGVAGTGTYTTVHEYSQGAAAWAACVDLVDGTNSFKTAYLQRITHTKQLDWAPEVIEGLNKYWIRCRCTDAGAGYNQPLGTHARVGMYI